MQKVVIFFWGVDETISWEMLGKERGWKTDGVPEEGELST